MTATTKKAADVNPDAALVEALVQAQAEFPNIAKGKTATVPTKNGGKYTYSYADLGDVLAAVRPVLAQHGLALLQPTYREDGRTILVTELRHVAGGSISSEVELGQNPNSPQAFGSALTYLRRYQATTLLGITADEDRDAQDVTAPSRSSAPAPPAPPWAQEATANRKAALLDALAPIIGRDAARDLAVRTRADVGLVPDVLVYFAERIAEALPQTTSSPSAEAIVWAAGADDATLARVATADSDADPDRVAAARAEVDRRLQNADPGDVHPDQATLDDDQETPA